MDTKIIKFFLIFMGVIFSQTLFSQENNKFSLTLEYSPNYSKLTDEVVNARFKISHNALVRIGYNAGGSIKPTIGIGFLNTGELVKSELMGQLGIESMKFIYNYNYLFVPIGAKINLGQYYFLPEIGLGFNISNKTRIITRYSNGEKERDSRDEQLIRGEFNKLSIPISLSVGKDFKIAGKSFSSGIKGYYGLNQIVEGVPRNNRYFGLGLILAMNL